MAAQAIPQQTPIAPRKGLLARAIKLVKKPQFWFGLFVLLPTAIWYILFAYRPIVQSFRMAVVDYRLIKPETSPFVGLQNFRTLFAYHYFPIAVKNTITYALMVNIGMLPMAMIVSFCLANVVKGRPIYQWALFTPVVVSMIAVALLFRTLLDPQIGVFNQILASLGLPKCKFLTGPDTAMPTIVAIDIWKNLGTYVVLLTAGLLNIPEEMYDAAKVDGANGWQIFWRITLPLLSYTLTLVVILLSINALQVYSSALVLTGGGPGTRTYMINLLIMAEAFGNFRFGLATAAAFCLFLAIMAITLIQLRVTRASWQY